MQNPGDVVRHAVRARPSRLLEDVLPMEEARPEDPVTERVDADRRVERLCRAPLGLRLVIAVTGPSALTIGHRRQLAYLTKA
jgi:hypothetical protein